MKMIFRRVRKLTCKPKNMKQIILLIAILSLLNLAGFAQVDTIRLTQNDLAISQLKPGLHQYLVYFQNPKKKKIQSFSLWSREVVFKRAGGQELIEVTQNWHSSDTTFNRYVYSLSKKENFEPVFHKTRGSKGVEGFNFMRHAVVASDSIADNRQKDLNKSLLVPTLNWELDLEIFSTLPIKKVGQRFIINFYHPGGSAPAYYEYKVIGTEKISAVNGISDCWQLKIDYREDSWAIFWISKKSNEVIKMQEYYRGSYRYKVKLATAVSL